MVSCLTFSFKIFLIILVALQPLHSYTVINTSSAVQDNGFHLLHAELCGSKYSNSISHTEKLSNLLDRINTALLADMPEDCVCCNSIDINSTDINTVKYQYINAGLYTAQIHTSVYAPNVKLYIPYKNQSRAPPLV